MITTEVAHARTYLANKKEALEDRLTRIERDLRHLAQPLSADSGERALEVENDDVLEQLAQSITSELAQVRRALERLDAGRYGTCEYCGQPISESRLHVLPEATRCSICINPRSARSRPARALA